MPANGETILLVTYTSSATLTWRSWRWISEWHWISWVANPSVWKTLSTVLVLNLFMFYCRWGQTMRDWWHLKVTPAARRNRKIVHWNSNPQQGGNREVKKKLQCSVFNWIREWLCWIHINTPSWKNKSWNPLYVPEVSACSKSLLFSDYRYWVLIFCHWLFWYLELSCH